MRPTTQYDTNYRNNISGNNSVMLDQRVGDSCVPTKFLWGMIQIGCNSESMKKITNNTEEKKEVIDQKPKNNIVPKNKKK